MKINLLGGLLSLFLLSFIANKAAAQNHNSGSQKPSGYAKAEPVYGKNFDKTCRYLTMPDGIRIAVDLYLPKGYKSGDPKLPTIMYQTRYVRSIRAKAALRPLKPHITTTVGLDEIEYFIQRGYAVVVVDTRGSGASFGHRKMEFSKEEVADGGQVMDWIAKQDWSNKQIGTSGVSYVATTAELTPINKREALQAVIPRSPVFDLYCDMCFVNGVRQDSFIKVWQYTTDELDNNNFAPFSSQYKLLDGINPVDADPKGLSRDSAVALHKDNFQFSPILKDVKYRDEKHPSKNLSIDEFSVAGSQNLAQIFGQKRAFLWIGGWYDGALGASATKGFMQSDRFGSKDSRLIMGPWDHGPVEMCSPHRKSESDVIDYNLMEAMLRHYDCHLKDDAAALADQPRVQYYTVGEEVWHTAETWPPAGFTKTDFFLAESKTLAAQKSGAAGSDAFAPDYNLRTGGGSRYNSMTNLYRYAKIGYPNWKKTTENLQTYVGAPLESDMEMTGHAIADLYLAADSIDATIFVYIDEIMPDGSVYYVTEGMFRALHRKEKTKAEITDNDVYCENVIPYHSFKQADGQYLTPNQPANVKFDLLPVSYLFRKGSRIRVSFAGCDRDHFGMIEHAPTKLELFRMGDKASKVILPLKKRS